MSVNIDIHMEFNVLQTMTYTFINYKEFTKLTETLIVNGVVIANGIADSDGDILDKKDIKTIFMKYQRDTDTMHTSIRNDGVEVFASWISEVDTIIAGKNVPSGSWLATFKITNPNLVECIQEGRLQGLSLGSVSEKALTPKYWFINKSLNYRDIKNIEEVIPLFISFVDKPANQYGFDVMTYDAYINKSEKDVKMTGENNQEAMIPVSALDKLRDFFTITKAEEDTAVEEPVAEEPTADETVTALFDKLDTIIEQNNQILEAINKADSEEEEAVDEEEEIEKADSEDEPSEEEKKEEDEEVEKSDSEEEKEESEEEAEDDEKIEKSETEEDTHIDKRQTNMIENQNKTDNSTFYQKTGRDHLGRKIRR